MPELLNNGNYKIKTLTFAEVLSLHQLLEKNFFLFDEPDPVFPSGLKDPNMLQSAVSRQHTGLGNYNKYDTIALNAATLVFGIINNHPFHNGNKRTGLMSLIKHLYENGWVLKPELRHAEIYKFIIAIADHKLLRFGLGNKDYKRYFRRMNLQRNLDLNSDQEVEFIAHWVDQNSIVKKSSNGSSMPISNLRKILDCKGLNLTNHGNILSITKVVKRSFLGYEYDSEKTKNYNLGNTRTQVQKDILLRIRQDFGLTEADGIDDRIFADEYFTIDEQLRQYKMLIYKLSKV